MLELCVVYSKEMESSRTVTKLDEVNGTGFEVAGSCRDSGPSEFKVKWS